MVYDVEKGHLSGFDEYLTKPLDIKRLLSVLGYFLLDKKAA